MTKKPRYEVSVFDPEESGGALVFTFLPKGLQHERAPGGAPKRAPQHTVKARRAADGVTFNWNNTSDDPGDARGEIEAEVAERLSDREAWIGRVTSLVQQVEQWAKELGWSTRRLEKKLDDSWIGKHRVPALLIQQDLFRALLEPIGRSTSGGSLVDLYMLPAYDDIASIYNHDGTWNIHRNMALGTNTVVPEPKEKAQPLTKETFAAVIAEMMQHAT